MKWLIGTVLVVLAISIAATTGGYLAESARSTTTAGPAATPTTSTIPGSTPGTATGGVPSPGTGTPSPTPGDTATPTTAAGSTFSAAEVAAHASSASCWLLIEGVVYDVTSYLGSHPGGARTITPWCGKESTTAFATEDGRGEHSPDAYALLDDYRIGALAR